MDGPSVIEKRTGVEKELLGLRLFDICTEEGMGAYAEALKASGGTSLIGVHVFYPLKFERPFYDNSNDNLTGYIKDLGQLINNFSGRKIPILIFERSKAGAMFRTDEFVSEAEGRLRRYLDEVVGLKGGNIFWAVTQQTSPYPLFSDHKGDIEDKVSGFMKRLEGSGLKKAVLCGSYFGGDDRVYGPDYLAADFIPMKGVFAYRKNWLLKDYYIDRLSHPFKTISPCGCLAEMVRALAFFGEGRIKIGVSDVTFPQRMPTIGSLESVDDKGITYRQTSRRLK